MLIGWLVLPVLFFLYLRFGYAPVATSAPLFPFEELLANTAVEARLSRDAPKQAPIPPSEANFMAGAMIYRKHCAECHGVDHQPESPLAKGMFPKPPQFFEQHAIGNEPVGQNYWIVANGIRLSGMPAYRGTLTEEELWQVSQFLSNRDKLTQSVKDYLSKP
jgi:mono/diheme cytochrome c family protein